MLPHGTTTKIRDFRTFLEILSFALAGKPTDANFVYYYLCVAGFLLKISMQINMGESMKASEYTLALLDDIERRIDPETEDDLMLQWESFWSGKNASLVFTPQRKKTSKPGIELKNIHINDAVGDVSLMLEYELTALSKKLSGNGALGIRANWGTGIMTSLFGAEIFFMPRESQTLPTTKSFNDSDKIREILDTGMPDVCNGFGKSVLQYGETCAELFSKYPKIQRYVQVYHPDTQGPLDIAELLWGGEMFYEMYDDPDLVHAVLRLITDTYKAFMERWYTFIPKRNGLSVHWDIMHKGRIMLRLDSAMNLSCDFYNEFSKPYDAELLDYFGGGCMHFCGRGDHYIHSLCEIKNMYGFNMSQPHLNDLDKIFDAAIKQGKFILGMPKAYEYANGVCSKNGIIHG